MTTPTVRRLRWALGIWLLAAVSLAWWYSLLLERLWILILPVVFAVAACGLALLVFGLVAAYRAAWRRGETTMVVGMLAAFALLLVTWTPLVTWGDLSLFHHRFNRDRGMYQRIVATVVDGTDGEPATTVRYRVDEGPPIRVAFVQPGGMIDNWEGVVYDPTGIVETAQGWRGGVAGVYTASAEARRLFGGDLVLCTPVEDFFYRCWFT